MERMTTISNTELKIIIDEFGMSKKGNNKSSYANNYIGVKENVSVRKQLKYFLDMYPAFKELYNGVRHYDDESRNDMSLTGWLKNVCKFDESTCYQIILNSPFFETKDEEHKQKFRDREDYFRRTYDNAEENFDGIDNEPIVEITEHNKRTIIRPISSVDNVQGYDWIIPNLLPRGFISLLFSYAGAGKTWIVIDLGIRLSLGLQVLGDIAVDKLKVVLLEGDTPDSLVKERVDKLSLKADDNYFQYVNSYEAEKQGVILNFSEPDGLKNLEDIIRLSNPDLIIIDTLISFVNDEKDAEDIRRVMKKLNYLATTYDCGILICHHTRKRPNGEKRQKTDQSDVIGTSIITRLLGCVIGIDKYHSSLVMNTKKSWFNKFQDREIKLVDTEDGKVKVDYTIIDNLEKNSTDKMCDNILDYIISNNLKEFKRKDIEQKFNNINAVRKALKKLEENGIIASYGNTRNKVFYIIENQPNTSQTQ